MSLDPTVCWGLLVDEAEEDSRVSGKEAEK